MTKIRARNTIRDWLPAYVNGTLDLARKHLVKAWLKRDENSRKREENWQALRKVAREQPQQRPSPAVYQRILADIEPQSAAQSAPGRSWVVMPAVAIGLVVLAVILLWQTLPPGLVLEWSVAGATPTQFQIYRAPTSGSTAPDDSDFVLLSELEARPGEAAYEYVDVRLLPGQNYAYRLEALDDAGLRSISQTVVRRSQDALLGQIALLAAFAIALAYLWLLVQQLLPHTLRRPWVGAW
jgi:anti-sigma factor RsiW